MATSPPPLTPQQSDGGEAPVETVVANLPHWFTLNFPDREVEKGFRAYFFRKRIKLIRTCYATLAAVAIGVCFYRLNQIDDYNDARFLGICLGGMLPLCVIWLALSFLPFYKKQYYWLNSVIAAALGAMNVTISAIGGSPDHGPQMLYAFSVFLFQGVRFPYAWPICWALYFSYFFANVPTADYGSFLSGFYEPQRAKYFSAGYMAMANFSLMFAAYLTEYSLRMDFHRHSQSVHEATHTQELLKMLLPERVTEKLKAIGRGGFVCGSCGTQNSDDATSCSRCKLARPPKNLNDQLIAEEFGNVSILFSDIVGFTKYSSSIEAGDVVEFLNTMYSLFDAYTERHGVLKIETIGDAYFVASGVPDPVPDHASRLVEFAFSMGIALPRIRIVDGKDFKLTIRIGIHTGKVIAGVVGVKVPRYHLFGETVTIANLMESTGQPKQVQVSEAAYEFLKTDPAYVLESANVIDIKGINARKLKTYWVHRAADIVKGGSAGPVRSGSVAAGGAGHGADAGAAPAPAMSEANVNAALSFVFDPITAGIDEMPAGGSGSGAESHSSAAAAPVPNGGSAAGAADAHGAGPSGAEGGAGAGAGGGAGDEVVTRDAAGSVSKSKKKRREKSKRERERTRSRDGDDGAAAAAAAATGDAGAAAAAASEAHSGVTGSGDAHSERFPKVQKPPKSAAASGDGGAAGQLAPALVADGQAIGPDGQRIAVPGAETGEKERFDCRSCNIGALF